MKLFPGSHLIPLRTEFVYGLGAIVLSGMIVFGVLNAQPQGLQGGGETKKIPLKEGYTTFEQNGLKEVWKELTPAAKDFLREINESTGGVGASNLFLALAKDINGAVFCTNRVFMGCWGVETPVKTSAKIPSQEFWLVGYLGAGSSTPLWEVKSVMQKDKTIELHFKKRFPGIMTEDTKHQYFVWVPLGKLAEGIYHLHLIEEGEEAPWLSRRVLVKT